MPIRTAPWKRKPERYYNKSYRHLMACVYSLFDLGQLMAEDLMAQSTRPGFVRRFLAAMDGVKLDTRPTCPTPIRDVIEELTPKIYNPHTRYELPAPEVLAAARERIAQAYPSRLPNTEDFSTEMNKFLAEDIARINDQRRKVVTACFQAGYDPT